MVPDTATHASRGWGRQSCTDMRPAQAYKVHEPATHSARRDNNPGPESKEPPTARPSCTSTPSSPPASGVRLSSRNSRRCPASGGSTSRSTQPWPCAHCGAQALIDSEVDAR